MNESLTEIPTNKLQLTLVSDISTYQLESSDKGEYEMPASYKVCSAIISQSDEDPFILTVISLEDTINGNWSMVQSGQFKYSFPIINPDKIAILVPSHPFDGNSSIGIIIDASINIDGFITFQVFTLESVINNDPILANTGIIKKFIEIRVYD